MTTSASPSIDYHQSAWIRVAFLFGAIYLLAGLVFGWLAGRATSIEVRSAWRMTAWVVSALAFALHIRYEYVRLRSASIRLARHVALAVAIGAFGLALAANIHAVMVGSTHRGAIGLSLVLWPLVTALPAFVVALGAGAILARTRSVQ